MNSFAAPLRQARLEVMPLVPTLAPELFEQPTIILDAVDDSLERQGIDPQEVRKRDRTKAESHSIAGFLIDQQREHLVEGEGRNSRFRNFEPLLTEEGELDFMSSIQHMQDLGATAVESRYNDGPEKWWPQASTRYYQLGRTALHRALFTSWRDLPTAESSSLGRGLRTKALPTMVYHHLLFMASHVTGREERIEAAHDLMHLLSPFAGLHSSGFREVTQRPFPIGTISKGDSGPYRFDFAPASRGWFRPRRSKFPTTTLKCPAHVQPLTANGSVPAERKNTGDTNLERFVHASINAVALHSTPLLDDLYLPGRFYRAPKRRR